MKITDIILSEANLGSNEIPATKKSAVQDPKTKQFYTRPQLFLLKVKTGSPFTLVSGGDVIIDPKEAKKVETWLATGPAGTISLTTTDGQVVKNTQLLKTIEFGSKESETIKIKGSDVFISTDHDVQDFGNSIENILSAGGFPASEMYLKIANSQALKKNGLIGAAVINMAAQVANGNIPQFPPKLKPQEIKAIELYASEYLGVLGLLSGSTQFKQGNRQQFDEFVGTNLGDMIMYFPKSVSNPLADSFSVVNDQTGHAIKISSKAAGKGAPPSLSSLKLPEDVRKRYPLVAEFHDMATNPSLTQFTQPFGMLNWLYQNVPDQVPKSYQKILPFTDDIVGLFADSMQNKTKIPKGIMNIFAKRLSVKVLNNPAPDGGKCWYAVIRDVMDIVNSGAIEGFREALIESLGYNFIQLYTNEKNGSLVTEAFWPAKLSGQVRLKSKGSAGEMKGKISVEISPSNTKTKGPLPDNVPSLSTMGTPSNTPSPRRTPK